MRTRKNRLLAGLGAVLMATALSVAAPTAAQAATTCSGTYVKTVKSTNASGVVIGRIGIYRSGTKVCAVLVKAGPLYGVSSYTMLEIWTKRPGQTYIPTNQYRVDDGDFRYQTDALTVDTALGNRCAVIRSDMENRYGVLADRTSTTFCI